MLVSACGHPAARSTFAQPQQQIFRYTMPTVGGPQVDENRALFIESDGSLSLAGSSIEVSDISGYGEKIAVVVDPNTPSSVAVSTLQQLADKIDIEILVNKKGTHFGRLNEDDRRLKFLHSYDDKFDPYQLRVAVGHYRGDEICVASLDNRPVDSEQLYERAVMRIDVLIYQAGGIDKLIADKRNFDRMAGRIAAHSTDPWRCVAGAFYQIQAAGWPSVIFEVSE